MNEEEKRFPCRPALEGGESVECRIGRRAAQTVDGLGRVGEQAIGGEVRLDRGDRAGDILRRAERNHPDSAAYHRTTYMIERAKLLQWWADYIDQRRKGADVIALPQRAA